MSVVDNLGDDCFTLATESLHELIEAFAKEVGRKPTLAELCEILSWGALSCADDLLEGSPNQSITITGKAKRAKQSLKEGDVVCVPIGKGAYAPILYIGSFGTFGKAFGVFSGTLPIRRVGKQWSARPATVPVFVGDSGIMKGEWLIVANRPDLIRQFKEPQIFHHPSRNVTGADYGKFGLVETFGGPRRKATAKEAADFEDLPKVNRQGFFSEDQFVEYLRKRPR